MAFLAILAALVAVLLLAAAAYAVIIFNGLVRLRNEADKAWSNIDVLLKQRHDEIPRLVEVCRGYMQHEHETLEAVVRARAAVGAARGDAGHFAAQTAVTHTLQSLFAAVEAYPDLKADAAFRQLQSRISELEDLIADRRELFNETANFYNTRVEQFPDSFVAQARGWTPRALWRIAPADRQVAAVRFSPPGK